MWPRGWVEVYLYSSMTAPLEEGEWSAARPGRTLPPEKIRYPFYRRLGGPQGRSGRAENLVPTGIRSRTVQLVVSGYTNWATRPIYHTHTHIYIYIYIYHYIFQSGIFSSLLPLKKFKPFYFHLYVTFKCCLFVKTFGTGLIIIL